MYHNPKSILGRTRLVGVTVRITVSELVTCNILNRLIDGLGPLIFPGLKIGGAAHRASFGLSKVSLRPWTLPKVGQP